MLTCFEPYMAKTRDSCDFLFFPHPFVMFCDQARVQLEIKINRFTASVKGEVITFEPKIGLYAKMLNIFFENSPR